MNAPLTAASDPHRDAMWGSSWRQRLRLMPLFLSMFIADALAPLVRAGKHAAMPWRGGISVVIPERDAPQMLDDALAALQAATGSIGEPVETIVVVNGASRSAYDALHAKYPAARFEFHETPLGFARAIAAGVAHARHDWTLLLNNDMRVAPDCITRLMQHRADDVFAIGAEILQQSADGRREETGFTDWYVDGNGAHLFHAPPSASATAIPHVCASGGAALFRTSLLRDYLPASFAYDPFYWEDAEWSVRAWRDGWRVLFSAGALAEHRHRATTARFHAPEELARIVERNRLLFDARHAVTRDSAAACMRRICDLPYASQRELARAAIAKGVFVQRVRSHAATSPLRPPVLWTASSGSVRLADRSYSYRLRFTGRPRVLVVTPFAVFPPRHGGARRVTELVRALRVDYDVVLVSDEAHLYDARSFAFFDGLAAVYLVQRRESVVDAAARGMDARMRAHAHPALVDTVERALRDHAPSMVQVEHAELASLVERRYGGARWVLGLHDACSAADFSSPEAFDAFERTTLAAFDAVTVCSDEDAELVRHPKVACVPNGSAVLLDAYRPSSGKRMLFVGPFRYEPNARGIARFLREAYPSIRARIPDVELMVLGGDEALRLTRDDAIFRQPGVTVLGHRDDVPRLLQEAALTINPLTGIRGSAVKLVESLSAGRVCVSTEEGARGFHDQGFAALVTVPDIASMHVAIAALLLDDDERHRREHPDARLARYQWSACGEIQRSLYRSLITA